MAMRTGMNAPAVLIDKYIGTAYDVIKQSVDNLDSIKDLVTEAATGNLTDHVVVPTRTIVGSGISTITLLFEYTLGRNQLQVYVEGAYRSITSGALTEITSNTIQINEELPEGTKVDIIKIV
jgi:hypothetical protein